MGAKIWLQKTLRSCANSHKHGFYMKGVFTLPENMFFALFFVVVVSMSIFLLISSVADVQVNVVKASLVKLSAVDAAHIVESCLSGNSGAIKKEKLSQRLADCVKKTGIASAKITDIGSGEIWEYGKAGYESHKIFIVLEDIEKAMGRLHVQI